MSSVLCVPAVVRCCARLVRCY